MGHSEPLGNREKTSGGVRDESERERLRRRRRRVCGRRRCWLFLAFFDELMANQGCRWNHLTNGERTCE